MNIRHTFIALVAAVAMNAQNTMTPERMWMLNKLSVSAVSPDQNSLIYSVGTVDLKTEKTNRKNYLLNLTNRSSATVEFGKK